MTRCSRLFLLAIALIGCGLQPKNLPTHRIVASSEAVLPPTEDLRFGVLGNTRSTIPLVDGRDGAVRSDSSAGQVVGDLLWQKQQGALDFVVLLGDMVRASRDAEWVRFDEQWSDLLEGSTAAEIEGRRIPVLPVVGDREAVLDERLQGYGATFPGSGADIGFNRVASWGYFDQVVGGSKWRFLVVDTNKKALGSRWREQLFWLPKAARGDYEHLLVFMHHSRISLAADAVMNPERVPQELVEVIEEHAGLMKLRAVFSAGGHSSEIYLPEGRLGTAYVGAGAGGSKAAPLRRWGDGTAADMEAIQLEPRFDLALQQAIGQRESVPQIAVEEARAEGSWEGFVGAYNPKHFPLYGYWIVDIAGDTLRLGFRLVEPSGALKEIYSIQHRTREGWSQP